MTRKGEKKAIVAKNGIKSGGKNFQKGQPGGPGAPKLPEDIKQARKLNSIEAERILNKFLDLDLNQLVAFVNNKSNNVHELLVARILAEAIKKGDHSRLEWIYQRLLGKIKEKVEMDINNNLHFELLSYFKNRSIESSSE